MTVMKVGGPGASMIEIVDDEGAVTRTARSPGEQLDLPAFKVRHDEALAGRAAGRRVDVVSRTSSTKNEGPR